MRKNRLIVLIFILILAVIGFFIYQKYFANKNTRSPAVNTEGWNTYKNTNYSFELMYPDGFLKDNVEPSVKSISCQNVDFSAGCPRTQEIQNMIYDFNAGRLSTFNIIEINNSIKFCQAIDAEGSGQTAYKNYLFLTIKNSDCLIIKMPVVYTDCQSYLVGAGGSTTQTDNYRSCVQSNIQTSQTLKEILSTFKFIKN